MFNEPSEKELSLLPVLVHGVGQVDQIIQVRMSGFSVQGQIAICIDGSGTFTDPNNHVHQIMPGDIFFFAPDTAHSYAPVKKPWIVKYIVFSGYELDSIFQSLNLPSSGKVVLKSDLAPEINELMDSIFAEYKSGKASRHIVSSAYMYRLLTLISMCINNHSEEFTASMRRLSPAIHYINKHFSDISLSSEMIAENSKISYPHMCRLFRTVYNMSPRDYITQTRLEYAKHLLSNHKDMTVQMISDQCGFSSPGYFTKVFKLRTGLTPIEFRLQNTYHF